LIAWAGLGDGVLRDLVQPADAAHPRQFRAAVEAASRQSDRVLIDCPPGFADPALLAALVADLVRLPSGPSPLDIMAAKDAHGACQGGCEPAQGWQAGRSVRAIQGDGDGPGA